MAETGDDADDHETSPPGKTKRPTLTLDVSLYESYLQDSDLSEDQKREFLEALWSVIVGFVDLGFGLHPVQQAMADNASDSVATRTTPTPSMLSSWEGIQACHEESEKTDTE